MFNFRYRYYAVPPSPSGRTIRARRFQRNVAVVLLLVLFLALLNASWHGFLSFPSGTQVFDDDVPFKVNKQAGHEEAQIKEDTSEQPSNAPFLLHIHLRASCDVDAVRKCYSSLKSAEYSGDSVKLSVVAACSDPESQPKLDKYLKKLRWPSEVQVIYANKHSLVTSLDEWHPSRLEYGFVVQEGCQVSPLYYWYLKTAAANYSASEDDSSTWLFGISVQDQTPAGGGSSSSSSSSPELRQELAPDCQLLFPTLWKQFVRWQADSQKEEAGKVLSTAIAEAYDKRYSGRCRAEKGASFITLMSERGYYNLFAGQFEGRALCTSAASATESGSTGAADEADRTGSEGEGGDGDADGALGSSSRRVAEEETQHLFVENKLVSRASLGDRWEQALEPVPLEDVKSFDMCGRRTRGGLLAQDDEQLQEMLASIHEDMSIIMVMASEGFDSMLANWLCYVKELYVRNYVIVTPSLEQAKRMVRQGHSVYHMGGATWQSGSMDYGTVAYKLFILDRTKLVRDILRFGYNVLLADVDAVWLDNPFSHMSDPRIDVYAQVEAKGTLCGGFLYMRSSLAVRQLWNKVTDMYARLVKKMVAEEPNVKPEDMADWLTSYQHQHEQRYLNRLVTDKETDAIVSGLDVIYFPNGRDYFDRRKSQKANVEPIVIHNNYIKGNQNKTRRFQRNGLWRVGPDGQSCTCLSCDYWQKHRPVHSLQL